MPTTALLLPDANGTYFHSIAQIAMAHIAQIEMAHIFTT
jgi:hypothetical protein